MQYKCTKCGNIYEFSKNPNKEIEMCPNCKGIQWTRADGNGETNSNTMEWLKENWWKIVVGVAVFILLILLLKGCSGEIEVKVDTDKEKHSLKVETSEDCQIILSKNGIEVESRKKTKKASFSDLYGSGYKLLVKPLKDSDKKVGSYPKIFAFSEKPVCPTILKIVYDPKKLTKKTQEYTVTIELDTPLTVGMAEYSMDGVNYQSSNEFIVEPMGKTIECTFYARNIDYPDLIDKKSHVFAPYIPNIVTKGKVMNWMKKIFEGDTNADDEMRDSCGAETPVEGIMHVPTVQDLIVYVQTNGAPNSVDVIHDKNNDEVIVKIKVSL